MKHELCPPYCTYDPEADDLGGRRTCSACMHADDILVKPYSAVNFGKKVTVVGFNGNLAYILTDGSLGMVQKKTLQKCQ
jgi:hypothetical protein